MKNKIKSKANNARNQREATGGRIIDDPIVLTDFEERVVSLITTDAVYGIEDTSYL